MENKDIIKVNINYCHLDKIIVINNLPDKYFSKIDKSLEKYKTKYKLDYLNRGTLYHIYTNKLKEKNSELYRVSIYINIDDEIIYNIITIPRCENKCTAEVIEKDLIKYVSYYIINDILDYLSTLL